jgi:hypothetical protein
MNQPRLKNRAKAEEPVWCDICRVRIAPYEGVVARATRRFHQHCFRKVELEQSNARRFDEDGLDLVPA